MKDTPNVVTPTVVTPTASTIGTPNPFAALAETPESESESVAESVVDIPDDEYLPNQVDTEEHPDAVTEANPATTTTTATSTDATAQPSNTAASDTNTTLLVDSNDLSLSSISTMGSSDIQDDAFSKAKISGLMERIQQGYTRAIKA